MTKKSRLLLGLLLSVPGMACALGLGDIRLGSGLNQPLVAEIELVGATPEELAALRAGLATREAFGRYGLDRPPFLSTFTFNVKKDATGRNVVEVRSTEALTEPFVTFLVEVNWPRGRLIREYTLLLDPPTFAEQTTPSSPLAVPTTGEPAGAAAGAIERPAAGAATAAAPAAEPAVGTAAEVPGSIQGGEYRVVAGDTLSRIARQSGAGTQAELNRLMIGIYRANPQAFAGNINRLNRGAVLRIPGSTDLASLSSAEAGSEVRRQMADWRAARGAGAAPGAEAGHLRLVTPTDIGPGGASTQPAPAPAEAAAAAEPPAAGASGSDRKRLLELKNEELARLQAQKSAPPARQPTAGAAPAATPAATAAAEASQPAAAAAPPPAAEPERKPVEKPKARPKKQPAAKAPASSFLGDNLLYVVAGGVLLLLAGLVGVRQLQKRRDAQVDDALRTLDRGDSQLTAAPLPTLSATARIPREEVGRDSFVVEEDDSGEFQAPPEVRAAAPRAPEPRSTEDTLSSETALNLEQADPLAEADFHMAYGLYDQAADIVKLALEREPERRELRLKLLEVYFVWGNRDAFMDVARELGRSRDRAPAGEWDKVAIMGRQIAPDEPLFAGAGGRGAAADVDLNLAGESGTAGVDLELLGEDGAPAAIADSDVDLDLGGALGGDSLATTGESRAPDLDDIDFTLGEAGGNTTREMAPRAESPTVEQPMLGGTTRELAPRLESPTVEQPRPGAFGGDAPTIESPALAARDGALRARIAAAGARRDAATEATSELSLDDLGFDAQSLGAGADSIPSLAATDHPADAPTMIASLDDRSRVLLEKAAQRAPRADLEATRESPRPYVDDDLTQLAAAMDRTAAHRGGTEYEKTEQLSLDAADTGAARVLGGGGDLDLDLDELAKALESDTVEQPRRDDLAFSTDVFATGRQRANGAARGALDLDVGAAAAPTEREPTVTERINVDDLALPELEPVTLSEVGTKLDLARAYMDMGDPDGARSILQEVLGEGSASQKQEAQRLIETLPG